MAGPSASRSTARGEERTTGTPGERCETLRLTGFRQESVRGGLVGGRSVDPLSRIDGRQVVQSFSITSRLFPCSYCRSMPRRGQPINNCKGRGNGRATWALRVGAVLTTGQAAAASRRSRQADRCHTRPLRDRAAGSQERRGSPAVGRYPRLECSENTADDRAVQTDEQGEPCQPGGHSCRDELAKEQGDHEERDANSESESREELKRAEGKWDRRDDLSDHHDHENQGTAEDNRPGDSVAR